MARIEVGERRVGGSRCRNDLGRVAQHGRMTSSFSGNAFSVKIGRGKFMFPLGHPRSRQNVRMWLTNAANLFGRQRVAKRRHL